MKLPKHIQGYQQQVEQRIESLFLVREPKSLYEPMKYPLAAGGKRIRPILLMLSCQAVGGRIEDCLDAATAVELLHTFTLVHDDIMDHDDLRRGKPTVHKRWDESTAILAGDGLVTLSYLSLLKTAHPEIQRVMKTFTEGLLVLCEGQAMDKAFETADHVPPGAYETMIARKTAKLIEVSCEIGGILGNASSSEIDALIDFAHHLGMAFQIQDDLLDLSDDGVTGKPLGSDIISRKKTFLTIQFFHSASSADHEVLESIWRQDVIDREDVKRVQAMFARCGIFQHVADAVRKRISIAQDALHLLNPSSARNDMESYARMIEERVA